MYTSSRLSRRVMGSGTCELRPCGEGEVEQLLVSCVWDIQTGSDVEFTSGYW